MQQRRMIAALAIASALALIGCDRLTEKYVSPENEPPPPASPVQIPSLTQTRVPPRFGGGPAAPGGRSAEAVSQGASSPAADEGKDIQGVIRLGEGVNAPDQGVLFVMARVPGMRPPMAALKLPVGPFPMQFSIGAKDRVAMMGANVPFEGQVELSARVDLDGNPMTRGPGELSGSAGQVEVGSTGIEIVLGAEGN